MDKLERYAKEREKEFEDLNKAAKTIFRSGDMDEKVLDRVMRKAFKHGHYVGHCRGENHKLKLVEEELG